MIVYVLTSTRTYPEEIKSKNDSYCVVEDTSDEFEGVAKTPELLQQFVRDFHKYDGEWRDIEAFHGRSWMTKIFKQEGSSVFFCIHEYKVIEKPLPFWNA